MATQMPCRQCGLCDSDAALLVGRAARELQIQSTGDVSTQPADGLTSHLRLAQLQQDDQDIQPIYQALRGSADRPEWESMLPQSQITKTYWTKWQDLEMHDRVMYIKDSVESGTPKLRLVAHKAIQTEIIREAHAEFTGGHLGRRAYWVARYKRGQAPRQGPLQCLQTGEPCKRVL